YEAGLVGETVDLATEVIGNLPVTNLNSGTGADATTFWRGDGTWAPAGGISGSGTANTVAMFTGATAIGDSKLVFTSGALGFSPTAVTGLSAERTDLTVTIPNHQFSSNVTTERFVRFVAPTPTGSAATKTLTTAATVSISGPPAAGSNLAITTPLSFWVE